MQQVLVLMAAVFTLAVGMLVARRSRPVAWSLIAVLIYLPCYWIWFLLQYLQIVPVDALLLALASRPMWSTPRSGPSCNWVRRCCPR